ncbi:MAG: heme peroxidase, partial [Cyanobacteria bacterium P01_D01_bin.116]
QGDDGKAKITVTKKNKSTFDNTVGFYSIKDEQGTVVDKVTGQTLTPVDGEDYLKTAISNSVAEFQLKEHSRREKFQVDLPDNSLLAPYLIQDGNIEDFENGDAQALLSFGASDSNNSNSIVEIGNGDRSIFKFSFGDLTDANSNNDNEMTMKVRLVR